MRVGKIKNRNPVLIVKTIGKVFDKTSVWLDNVSSYDMRSADLILSNRAHTFRWKKNPITLLLRVVGHSICASFRKKCREIVPKKKTTQNHLNSNI